MASSVRYQVENSTKKIINLNWKKNTHKEKKTLIKKNFIRKLCAKFDKDQTSENKLNHVPNFWWRKKEFEFIKTANFENSEMLNQKKFRKASDGYSFV